MQGKLWWRNIEGVIFKFVDKIESKRIVRYMYEGVCGGHYMAKTTAHKVIRADFWWPTLFRDAHKFVKICDT